MPRVDLAELPTPVERLDAVSERTGSDVWIKRDDRTSPRYGGNKVRKLEYLLGEALAGDRDTLITSGAAGSHHALATTLFGRALGLDVHVALIPQRYSVHVEEHLRAVVHAGAVVHATSGGATLLPRVAALRARLRFQGRRPQVIPPGGSSVAGVLGHVEAGLELARQIESVKLPEPDEVIVPLGSGGTAVGLAIGLAAAGLTSRVVGVRVVPRSLSNRTFIGAMIGKAVAHLRRLDNRFPDVSDVARSHLEIDGQEYGEGYGIPSRAGRSALRNARELANLELDPTYTAKAFAATLRRARTKPKRILFIHTLNSLELDPGAFTAPPLPRALRRLMRHA